MIKLTSPAGCLFALNPDHIIKVEPKINKDTPEGAAITTTELCGEGTELYNGCCYAQENIEKILQQITASKSQGKS
jgi:uncharacterized protein YlzI (FlbEa/FlbD family)